MKFIVKKAAFQSLFSPHSEDEAEYKLSVIEADHEYAVKKILAGLEEYKEAMVALASVQGVPEEVRKHARNALQMAQHEIESWSLGPKDDMVLVSGMIRGRAAPLVSDELERFDTVLH